MVGSGPGGDLYSVHDMKHELVGSIPGKVVVTLDCCRDKRGAGKQFVTLRLFIFVFDYVILVLVLATQGK